MKHLLPLLLVTLFAVSCQHKDGAPDHRKRIQAVYSESAVSYDDVPFYNIDRHKVQEWKWDGNELYRIDYCEDVTTYSENIFYDRRHRISRTTVPAYGLRSEFAYKGRKLDTIYVYQNDQLSYLLLFTHADRHITSITQHFFATPSEKALAHNPLHIINEQLFDQIPRSKGTSDVVYSLEWNKGNVKSIKTTIDGESTLMRFTYDDKRNPLHDLFLLYELQDDEPGTASLQDGQANLLMLSENNILTLTRAFNNDPNYQFNYSYTYNDKYPETRTVRYQFTRMNNESFQDQTVSVVEKRYYEYLD